MRLHLPDVRLVLATAAISIVASLSLALSHTASVSVDGQRIRADVAPVTAGGAAYLPVRAIAEAGGGTAGFDRATGRITIRSGNERVEMHVGDRRAVLNGRPILLAHAPFVVRGRAMLRGSDVALALGSSVRYDARRDRIDVRTPAGVVAGAADDQP